MLVLSRRDHDQVVFPNLGITVHVLRIEGKTVRLGIEAPRDVTVLRHEIAEAWNQWHDYPAGQRPGQLGHALRNRLHAATLGLHQLHRQLEQNELENAEATIFKIFRELASMDKEVSTIRPAAQPPLAGRPRQALVVEDNQNECELLAGYLRICNFDVATTRDGADALEYLTCNQQPHIVLLDMNMPRMDGQTTIERIREHPLHAGLMVFAISGIPEDRAPVRVGPGGVDRWFTKPIRPDLLVGEIDRHLAQSAQPAS